VYKLYMTIEKLDGPEIKVNKDVKDADQAHEALSAAFSALQAFEGRPNE
jgi:hypothetical protein